MSQSCIVPADQTGSFMGRVSAYPLTLTADADFSDEERATIGSVVDQWNAFGREVIGGDVFNLRFAAIPGAISGGNPTNCEGYFNADASGGLYLVREGDIDHWTDPSKLNLTKTIPGATFRCEANYVVVHQIVFVYPELAASQQLGSILLHEFGHVVGLDHSCLPDNPDGTSAGRSDFASCTGLSANHPYRTAVMYPWLRYDESGRPEVKDFLRANDKQRGQCIIGS